MEFIIANIIMSISTAAMVLYGLIYVCVNNEDDKESKKSKIGDFVACFITLIVGFFVLFNYVTIEINNQVNDKIKELKEELNTETTTTTETTTIPTTITDDDGNIYVLQTTSTKD
jgi:cytochrome bd-type quinol oxidase subunit 2